MGQFYRHFVKPCVEIRLCAAEDATDWAMFESGDDVGSIGAACGTPLSGHRW